MDGVQPMSAVEAREVLEQLDFTVACSAEQHSSGVGGHDPRQQGTYVVRAGCPGCGAHSRAVVCRSRADFGLAWGREGGLFECDLCGHVASVFAFWHAIEPLEGGLR